MADCVCGRELDANGDCYACDDPDGWHVDDAIGCYNCQGEGEVVWCPDDICRGSGECIHGDGMMTCPRCGGSGDEPQPPAESRPQEDAE